MGIFDSIFTSSGKTSGNYTPNSETQAWVNICYAALMADGLESEVESDRFTSSLVFNKLFLDEELIELIKHAMNKYRDLGVRDLISLSAGSISDMNKGTLFASVIELMMVDGLFETSEREITEFIAIQLGMDIALSTKILEVMLIKTRLNRRIAS